MLRWKTTRDQRMVHGGNEKGMKRFKNESWSHEKIHVTADDCMQIWVSTPYWQLAANIYFFAVYDVCEIYVVLCWTSMPFMERRGRLSLSDSGRNVNNARVGEKKNQIFCHFCVNSFCRRRLTATLAFARESQLPPHLQWEDVVLNQTALLRRTRFIIYVLLHLVPPEGPCFITYPGVIHLILSISADNRLNHMQLTDFWPWHLESRLFLNDLQWHFWNGRVREAAG